MSNHDPIDLEAQYISEEELAEKQRVAARQEVEDIKWLMSEKKGRRIMWGLLQRTGVYRSSFTGDSETFFREGQRNVGLMLLDMLHTHCPSAYAKMVEESKQ